MLGIPEHAAWVENVRTMADEAKQDGADVSERVFNSLGMMVVRGEDHKVVRVSEEEFESLKKNGEASGS
jgi:hypothetical protein